MRNNGGLTIRNDGVPMENRPEKEETWSYTIWEKNHRFNQIVGIYWEKLGLETNLNESNHQ